MNVSYFLPFIMLFSFYDSFVYIYHNTIPDLNTLFCALVGVSFHINFSSTLGDFLAHSVKHTVIGAL